MEALERLHEQLHSLEQLRTIVSTMKVLSAASIRQYEQAVRSLAGYYQTVERGLHVVLKDMLSAPPTSPSLREPLLTAAIVFGSDHGLCGRFNEEISRYTLERLDAINDGPITDCLLSVRAWPPTWSRLTNLLRKPCQFPARPDKLPSRCNSYCSRLMPGVINQESATSICSTTIARNTKLTSPRISSCCPSICSVSAIRETLAGPHAACPLSLSIASNCSAACCTTIYSYRYFAPAPNPRPANTLAAWQRCRRRSAISTNAATK